MRIFIFIICLILHINSVKAASYINVKEPTNNCTAAFGDNITDDTASIQCHINNVAATGGGYVYFPSGQYVVTGITVPQAVWLFGDNLWTTSIRTHSDLTVLKFENVVGGNGKCNGGNHYGGLYNIAIDGYYNINATSPAVIIGNECNVTIYDASLMYGKYGIDNRGVDSRIERSMVWGFTGGMISSGANWYRNVKFNQPGTTSAFYAVYLATPIPELTSVAENHFTDVDFSGTYNYSVYADDSGTNKAITVFQGAVFAAPVVVASAKATMFSGIEFGHTTLYVNSGYVNIVGSYAFSSTSVSGAGIRSCAGNSRIAC